MNGGRRALRGVYERVAFNALCSRLPRSVRRSVEPAPPGHLGLVVQIVSADDYALATVRGHVPVDCDVKSELARLEAEAHEQLTGGRGPGRSAGDEGASAHRPD
jgi:hypothetical protein